MTGSVLQLDAPITGARSDLVFLHSPTPYAITTAEQALFPEGGKMVSGAYKLMQQVVVALFTPIGGVSFQTTRGTNFAKAVLGSSVHSETALREVFAISKEQVLAEFQLRQTDVSQYPPEEVLTDLVLRSLVITGDVLELGIDLHTGADQIISITLPVAYHG